MSSSSKAFDMSKMAIGGIGQMLDSVEFVKRAWSTFNIPSTLVPTVDIEELDKRIADLKAVEQWLNVNMSMLHGTIQGLEIQRGTLAAVKAFSASLGNLRVPGTDEAAALASMRARMPPTATVAPQQPAPAAPAQAAPEPEPQPAGPSARGTAKKAAATRADAPPPMPGLDPTAWWSMLQQNFNQVAEAALTGGGLQGAAANALKTAGSIAGAAARGATAATAVAAGAAGKAASGATPAPAPARKRAAATKRAAPTRPKTPRAGR
jgi:hypothetical protein